MIKKTLAKKMRTQKEIKAKAPIFQTEAWTNRKKLTEKKIENNIAKIKAKKIERIAKQEAEGIKQNKNHKLTEKEKKQIIKRVKRIKFISKVKSLIK